MDTRYMFTVPTKGICVICLEENSDNGLKEVSLKRLSQFLDLDYKKIFNIQKSLFPGETTWTEEDERECVDIKVSLCKGCNKIRNKFYALYKQYEWIMQCMEMCVQNIHEVMVTGENNAECVRKFQDQMIGTRNRIIENSIPSRFRRETMSQCLKHARYSGINAQLETKIEQKPYSMASQENLTPCSSKSTLDVCSSSSSKKLRMIVNEPLVSELSLTSYGEVEMDDDFEEDDVDDDEKNPEELCMSVNEPLVSELSLPSYGEVEMDNDFEEDDVDDDEEKDPEELMGEFDAYVSFNKEDKNYLLNAEDMIHATAQLQEPTHASFQCSDSDPSPKNDIEFFEFEKDLNDAENEQCNYMTQQDEVTEGTGRPEFSSMFQCDICGKVILSLRNFKIHRRWHKGDLFECVVCKHTFTFTTNLRSHTLRFHRNLLFAKFRNPELSLEEFSTSLECIVRSVMARIPIPKEALQSLHYFYRCRLCGKQYTRDNVLGGHVVQQHYTIIAKAVASMQTLVNQFSSEDFFQYMNNLQKQGANWKSSSCGVCGKQFSTGEKANMHIRSHIKYPIVRNKCDVERRKVTFFTPSKAPAIRMKMKCEPCGRYFEDLEALNKHKQQFRNGACTGIRNKINKTK